MMPNFAWISACLGLSLSVMSLQAAVAADLRTNGVPRTLSDSNVPPRLSARAGETGMEVTWPADRSGWWLEGQTNAIGEGLSTNWYPIAESAGTNRICLPIDPKLGSAFTRLASAPSMKSLRKAAADRRRRIIFNNDGNEPVYQMTKPTMDQLLDARTRGLVGSQVDSIFYCPWSSGFSLFTHFTKVGQPFTSREGRYGTNQMPALIAAGIDPLRVMVDFAKTQGIELFCSFRMNDTHDGSTADYGPPLLRTNQFKQSHPEYLIGSANQKPKHGEWTAVDYARPEIRDLAFRFAEEVCLNYDVDGLEFDFFRHPVFFKSNAAGAVATDAERACMTDLFRRIRDMADKAGRARGRPILIAMRLPDSVEYCRAIGLDIENWLANDLLDLLVVSGYFQLNDWNYSVALARQYGVKIYPSLDPCIIRDATSRAVRTTELAFRGRAANVWGFGADGVYMFNSFDSKSPLWRELGDSDGLSTMDKDYFGSVRGVVVAAGGNLPFTAYQKTETLNPSNSRTVAPGGGATARLNVGEDLSKAGPVMLTMRLRFQASVDPRHLQVDCNNVPLAFQKVNAVWLEYSVPIPAISRPFNVIKIRLAESAPQAVWTDLMLQVRH